MKLEDEGLKRGIYKDLKGIEYELIGIGRNVETYEKIVICKTLDDNEDYQLVPLHLFKMKKRVQTEERECYAFIKSIEK